MKPFFLSAFLLFFIACTFQKKQWYPVQAVPDVTPVIFSPQLISLAGRFEQSITFSGDGKEYYYGTTDSKEWWYRSILRTRIMNDGRTVTDTPVFIKNFSFVKEPFIGEPFLSRDGRELYFVAGIQPDIWVSRRERSGDWTTPVLLGSPVNTKAGEWNPSLSKRGTLYFASTRTDSGRIYKAERVNDAYPNVERLRGAINEDDAGDPCIAPDETFIVFSSWKKGGYGGTDLYVSRRQEDGSWSVPISLGPEVNTREEEVGPRISPDGKYLFFHRRDKWQNATSSDIYWVSMEVVKRHLVSKEISRK